MEHDTFPRATAVTRPRLYNIVHTYIQRRLPRDIHPAFKALRNREEAATSLPQIGTTQGTALRLIAEPELGPRTDQDGGNQSIGHDDDTDDLPLYPTP